ncbi:MAG: hypothetical protein RSC87_10040, partial [Muribaculaceae bacterium]
LKGKESIIRSSSLINLIHDAVKYELINKGVYGSQVYPPLGSSKPELKIAGFLKQKDQDVCVAPKLLKPTPQKITWGPLANENIIDIYGHEYSKQALVINVRSQLSSIAKNTDTLFERTFAEALNLHMTYHDMVLGEVYLIPVYEYDEATMNDRKITFKSHKTNIAKYISFFSAINNRANVEDDLYKYERCTLLIVDFRYEQPKLYSDTAALIADGLLPKGFPLEMANLSFGSFASDILSAYSKRFEIKNLGANILL